MVDRKVLHRSRVELLSRARGAPAPAPATAASPGVILGIYLLAGTSCSLSVTFVAKSACAVMGVLYLVYFPQATKMA